MIGWGARLGIVAVLVVPGLGLLAAPAAATSRAPGPPTPAARVCATSPRGAAAAPATFATTRDARSCITLAQLASEPTDAPADRVSLLGTASGVIARGVSTVTDGIGTVLGASESAAADIALRGIAGWIAVGARDAVREAGHLIDGITTPRLTSAWFSATYWRVAGLGALLTIPFLFAAAVQAVAHGDLAGLGRAVFGHLPLALLAVSLAAPIVTLLLAATDEMCRVVSGASGATSSGFLDHVAIAIGTLGASGGSFFVVVLALVATLAALSLTLEMLIREAAVYVVVLMLPLAFAALVWPARRSLVARMLELLVGLVLSKFVIVAVLTLAGAAIVHASGTVGIAGMLAGVTLLMLSVLAPWTMMRLLPFTEVAASASGMVRAEAQRIRRAPAQTLADVDTARHLLNAVRGDVPLSATPQTDDAGVAARQLLEPSPDADRASVDASEGPASGASGAGPAHISGASAAPASGAGADHVSAAGAAHASGGSAAVASGSDGDGRRPTDPVEDPPAPGPGPGPADRGMSGADAFWQHDNGAWPEIRLGPDHAWGGPVLGAPGSGDSPLDDGGGDATTPSPGGSSPTAPDSGADDTAELPRPGGEDPL